MSRLSDLLDRVRLHDDYQAVFETPAGRKVLAHICRVGNVMSTSFIAGDSHGTAFEEGKRFLALSILRFICKDHAKLIEEVERQARDSEDITN